MTISSRVSAGKNPSRTTEPFIKYEPHLVEELQETKPSNCKVSGRLLSILYNRLVFWSRYSKHIHNKKRYFWKSIRELSEELSYSAKQIERALPVLVELGLIVREKLQKHNYRQVWFYHLPKSPHTAEVATDTSSRRENTSRGSSNTSGIHSSHTPATTGFPAVSVENSSIRAGSPVRNEENVCIYQKKYNIKNTLQTIVEKCLLYGEIGIVEGQGKRFSAGLGFA